MIDFNHFVIEMEFLRENKDILFEISKYLSRRDIDYLTSLLPELIPLFNSIHQLKDDIVSARFRQMGYFFAIEDLAYLFNRIFTLTDDLFLLYNRQYDFRKKILTADVDYAELIDIHGLDDDLEYREFISPIILPGGIILKLRNGHQFYQRYQYMSCYYELSRIKKEDGEEDNEFLNSLEYRQIDVFISKSYIRYLIETERIFDYIDQNRKVLSDRSIYVDENREDKLFLGKEMSEVIWNYLFELTGCKLIE